MRMPFGKHRGARIDDLPFDYLEWLVEQDFLREPLSSKIQAEYSRRCYSQKRPSPVKTSIVDELVGAGVRALAKRHHPDMGGDHAKMLAINQCADWLREQARRIAG